MVRMYDEILVPTDGSNIAERAGRLAVAVAAQFDSTIHTICIVTPDEREHGDSAVAVIESLAAETGIQTMSEVVESTEPVHREILGYVDEHDLDAVAMGTHGRTGLNRFLIGSVALQTLREARVPVITVHEETEISFDAGDILLPTDGSAGADAAAAHAIELASRTGATLHILHAGREQDGRAVVDAVAARVAEEGIDTIETVVSPGQPHLVIESYATAAGIDSIVMGTHGKTGLRRYLLGSVTERTVRFATVPVITIRQVSAAATVEFLDYVVLEDQGWSIDDPGLFENASTANLPKDAYGVFSVTEGEYLLDAAEEAGYEWPFRCRAGACVNCAAILIEGDVEMEMCRSLSEEEIEDEHIRLTCVATPKTDTAKLVVNAKELDFLRDRTI